MADIRRLECSSSVYGTTKAPGSNPGFQTFIIFDTYHVYEIPSRDSCIFQEFYKFSEMNCVLWKEIWGTAAENVVLAHSSVWRKRARIAGRCSPTERE